MKHLDPMSNSDDILQQREAQKAASVLQQEDPIAPRRMAEPLPLDPDEPESNLRTMPLGHRVAVPDSIYRRLELQPDRHVADDNRPYHYRLPRGSYILAFFYAQLLFVTTYLAVTLTDNSLSGLGAFSPVVRWGVPGLSLLLCLFIISGNNILRILAIILSFSTVATIIYELIMIDGSKDISVLLAGGWGFYGYIVLAAALPTVILLITASYLLNPKVSNAYQ